MPRSPQSGQQWAPCSRQNLKTHPVTQRLYKGDVTEVIVLAGAGISVSAGIPDFRSPGTGLYDNLQKYNLPEPEAVFTLDFFREDPTPFTLLAKELWPTSFRPTPTHWFVRLLDKKGFLRRHYTQNIDGLDAAAGISEKRLVQAHGSFGAGHCIECRSAFNQEYLRERIFRGEIVRCHCGGLVKPDIVFFGEDLPDKFVRCSQHDFQRCGLVICMGTSLQVEPFASLMERVPSHVPRILINREVPRAFRPRPGDLVLTGECDDQVWQLSEVLGWTEELQELVASGEQSKAQKDASDTRAVWWRRALALAAIVAIYVALVAMRPPPDGVDMTAVCGIALWCALVGAIAMQTRLTAQ